MFLGQLSAKQTLALLLMTLHPRRVERPAEENRLEGIYI